MQSRTQLRLIGAGGEVVDLVRVIASHGLSELAPARMIDAQTWETALRIQGLGVRALRISPGRPGYAQVGVNGSLTIAGRASVRRAAAFLLRLDEDLSPFYRMCS